MEDIASNAGKQGEARGGTPAVDGSCAFFRFGFCEQSIQSIRVLLERIIKHSTAQQLQSMYSIQSIRLLCEALAFLLPFACLSVLHPSPLRHASVQSAPFISACHTGHQCTSDQSAPAHSVIVAHLYACWPLARALIVADKIVQELVWFLRV